MATLGRTDIQVILPLGGRPHRVSVATSCTRAFQEACFQNHFPWKVHPVGDPTLAIPEDRTIYVHFDPQARTLSSSSVPGEPVGPYDCRGGVTLCAPILSGTLVAIQRLQQQGRLKEALYVLLFSTRREPPEPSEPSFAAPILKTALAEAFDLSEEQVSECVFLERGDVYQQDTWGERHLACDAARRIDSAVQQLQMRYGNDPPLAVIADVGGIPETKSVLVESAHYRFGEVLLLRGTQPTSWGPASGAGRLISPAESLQARRQVRILLNMGAFDAAARLANTFVTVEQRRAEPWRVWLAAVAASFHGENPQAELLFAAEYTSEIRRELRRVLADGPPLLAAFRVEAALRGEAWTDALRATFTFLDASSLSLINRYLSLHPDRPCVDLRTSLLRVDRLSEPTRHALGLSDRPPKVYLSAELLGRLLPRLPPGPRGAIAALKSSLRQVRHFRNVATHSWLTGEQCKTVREALENVGLWNAFSPPHFLDARWVIDVLGHLGIEQPDVSYQNLIHAILNDMDAYSLLSA
jgi:hypothetical protein